MATYIELFNLRSNSELRNRIQTAIAIKSHAILQEATPSPTRLSFAEEALKNPGSKIEEAMWFLFAANKAVSQADILSATDATVQSHVDNYVDDVAP